MKKYLAPIVFLSALTPVFSQNDSLKTRQFRHELRFDVLALYQLVLTGSINTYADDPVYLINYRLKTRFGGIRVGVGGSYFKRDARINLPLPTPDDKLWQIDKKFDWRIGWEFRGIRCRRFEIYYGIDLKQGSIFNRLDAQYFDSGYMVGYKNRTTYRGAAALLGGRFLINKRFCISTDLDYTLYFQRLNRRNTFLPNSGFPLKSDLQYPLIDSYYTQFRQPRILNINFAF